MLLILFRLVMWDPHGSNLFPTWVPHGSQWDPAAISHMGLTWFPHGSHKDPQGSHMVPTCVPCGSNVGFFSRVDYNIVDFSTFLCLVCIEWWTNKYISKNSHTVQFARVVCITSLSIIDFITFVCFICSEQFERTYV